MPALRPLAVVTGASTGIGFELAKCSAEHGFDLVVAADEAVRCVFITAIRTKLRALKQLAHTTGAVRKPTLH
jgi:NAD(P)-dependent dehydrogenase (short-subunit alcohol dehydrogenase family)